MTDLAAMRLDVTEAQYHADPCPEPSLSSSIARVLVDQSPMHAHEQHPKLGATPREDSSVFDLGQLVHKLILGKGRDVVVIEADDWRTKAAKESRDQARAEDKIPVLRAQNDEAVTASKAIVERLAAIDVVLAGESEVAIAWEEQAIRSPIWARGKLDHLVIEGRRATVYDLKTSRSAHPRASVNHAVSYGYDIQQAAYTSGLSRLMPELAGRIEFVFLFVETTPPYAVLAARLDGIMRTRGETRWRSAVELWAECLTFDDWPGYARQVVTLEAPPWLLAHQESSDEQQDFRG